VDEVQNVPKIQIVALYHIAAKSNTWALEDALVKNKSQKP